MSDVYAGAVAPEAYVLDLTPGTSGVDLSTVTAASLKVRPRGGTSVTWTVTLSNQTSTTLTLTHLYVSGDIDIAGPYVVRAVLTIPSGTVKSAPRLLTVKGEFET